MSTCLDCPVGSFALIILIEEWLSLHVGVGSVSDVYNSIIADWMHLMFLLAMAAVISSASMELEVTIDWSLCLD